MLILFFAEYEHMQSTSSLLRPFVPPTTQQETKCRNLGNSDATIMPIRYLERFLTEWKPNLRRAQVIMNRDTCNWYAEYHPCLYVMYIWAQNTQKSPNAKTWEQQKQNSHII
jgi:hypothetical protein